jgi:hypothetical protein
MPCTIGLSRLNNNQAKLELCFGDGTNEVMAELSRAGSLYPPAMNPSSTVKPDQIWNQSCDCDSDGAHGRTQRVAARASVRA